MRRHELLEEAEVEATLAAHRERVAAGCPGAVAHEEAMAELLREQVRIEWSPAARVSARRYMEDRDSIARSRCSGGGLVLDLYPP